MSSYSDKDDPKNCKKDAAITSSQSCFNKAFDNALLFENQKNLQNTNPYLLAFVMLIWLILVIWSLMTALKSKEQRPLNILFAFLFPPLYLISFYLGQFTKVK